VIDKYLTWCEERPRKPLVGDTLRTYRQLKAWRLKRDKRRTWEQATMDEVDELEVDAYVDALECRNLAPSTLNQRRAVHQGAFTFARKKLKASDVIAVEDVWEHTPVPDSEDYDVYSPEEVWAIARAMGDLQDAAIILLAAFCGLRQSELRGLRWKHIDWLKAFVYVARKHTVSACDGLPKGEKVYAVPLPDQVAAVLDQLAKQRGTEPDAEDRVFIGEAKGGTVDPPALRRRFKAAQTAAGVTLDLRLHDLRHTFGTIAIEEWGDIEKVRDYMGDKDIRTTRRYLHRRPRREDAARMTAAIGGEFDVAAVMAKPLTAPRRGAEGQRNARSKLTAEKVAVIRWRLETLGETQKALADEYGLATSTMAYLANYTTWPDVLPAPPAESTSEGAPAYEEIDPNARSRRSFAVEREWWGTVGLRWNPTICREEGMPEEGLEPPTRGL
jgi:integrase